MAKHVAVLLVMPEQRVCRQPSGGDLRPAACAKLLFPQGYGDINPAQRWARASLSSRSSGRNLTRVPPRSRSGWRLMAVIWPQSGLASSFLSSARPCAQAHPPLVPYCYDAMQAS